MLNKIMNAEEEYNINQGSLMGEVRYEIYQKYGEELKATAHYFWARSDVSDAVFKDYHLVNSDPIKFLVATVTCPLVDIRPIDPETNQKINIAPVFIKDERHPTHVHLEWFDANIPFQTRDVLDENGITYNLP